VFTAAVNVLWTVGTATGTIAPVLGLMWAGPPTAALAPEGPPGSGIVSRNEVTAIWVPRALRDLERHHAGLPVGRSPEALQSELRRDGWKAAWYALTYRGHRINGEFAEITQIRRLSEAPDHLHEFQTVMATATGRPPRDERLDFSHARVKVIPDALQAVEPREASTRLMAEPVIGEKCSPSGGLDSRRRSE
jgi:hypothetical protein